MISNNRQLSPDINGIRDDHVNRYVFARSVIHDNQLSCAMDAGCGCGYGSYILAESGINVISVDCDISALSYGAKHYFNKKIFRAQMDFDSACYKFEQNQALVAFEIIEHLNNAFQFLRNARLSFSLLIGSVPNEDVTPYDSVKHNFHARHYTPSEIIDTLESCGWTIKFIGGQHSKKGIGSLITDQTENARTLVFIAS